MSWGRMTSIDSTQLMFFLGKKLDLPKAQRLGFQSFQWWHSKLLKLKTCSIFHVFWHQVSCLFLIPSHGKHIYIYNKLSLNHQQNFNSRISFMDPCFLEFLELCFNNSSIFPSTSWLSNEFFQGPGVDESSHHWVTMRQPAVEGDV